MGIGGLLFRAIYGVVAVMLLLSVTSCRMAWIPQTQAQSVLAVEKEPQAFHWSWTRSSTVSHHIPGSHITQRKGEATEGYTLHGMIRKAKCKSMGCNRCRRLYLRGVRITTVYEKNRLNYKLFSAQKGRRLGSCLCWRCSEELHLTTAPAFVAFFWWRSMNVSAHWEAPDQCGPLLLA